MQYQFLAETVNGYLNLMHVSLNVDTRKLEVGNFGRNSNLREVKTPWDQYVINKIHVESPFGNGDTWEVNEMLPESNRLSGNRHDAEERERLRGRDLFK